MWSKARVSFKLVRFADDDWNILAECSRREKSKTEIDRWIDGERRIACALRVTPTKPLWGRSKNRANARVTRLF